jgi:Helix-turn-helix domain/Transposase IS116/IS110/IS902 family
VFDVSEREEIAVGRAGGESMRAIARRLGRSPSTISRELARNASGAGDYRATAAAHAQAYHRPSRPKPAKLAVNQRLHRQVEEDLRRRYSPEQIVGRLRRQFPDDLRDAGVCRDDLPIALCPVPWGGASRSDPVSADGRALRRPGRQANMLQARDLIITAPQELREQLAVRKTLRAQLNICARFRPARDLGTPVPAAKLALRTIARRITSFDQEITALDEQLKPLVHSTAPRTTSLLGISTGHGGQFLVTAGQNIERLTQESSFAALRAASPIKALSGKTHRHRLNPGGDRQANRALHLIAVYRLGCCPRTQIYAARRTTEGKSKSDILRSLKRAIAREIYHALKADLADLATHTPRQPDRPYTAILGGSPGHGITRNRS